MNASQDSLSSSERRIALVVGVKQAPGAEDPILRNPLHADEDAKVVAQALQEYGGFQLWGDKVWLNDQATAASIQDAIALMDEQSTQDHLLLFYFSGHGLSLLGNDEFSYETYLATWDFFEPLARRGSRLSLRWLRDNLFYSKKAGKVVIILDSCYSGNLGRESEPFSMQVRQVLDAYFKEPQEDSGSRQNGLRQALLATGHAQPTRELQGHGLMTTYLLRALEGKADVAINSENGEVTLSGIRMYFEQAMPSSELSSLTTGGTTNQKAVLAVHERRARELRALLITMGQRPGNFIPFQRDTSLQLRSKEFEGPESLFALLKEHRLIGLVGRRGVGRCWLARELAFRCKDQGLYPDGIFWMSSGKNDDTSCIQEMQHLALGSGYLPPNDDGSKRSDFEEQRARHFCRYLAQAEKALLIIHNLENENVLKTILPGLAGGNFHCTIVYTALPDAITGINGVREYHVKPFSESAALSLLLKDVRSAILARYTSCETDDEEVRIARDLCRHVGYLPSPLISLRTLLQKNAELSLGNLYASLRQRGILNGIDSLKELWQNNWADLTQKEQQDFLLLASLFPADTRIPLWLLELVAGLQQAPTLSPISGPLERLGWIEVKHEVSEKQVILGHVQKEFAEAHLLENPQYAQELKARAAHSLVQEFTNSDNLQRFCKDRSMYWQCLSRQGQARDFAQRLDEPVARAIEDVERCLDRGSSFLVQEKRWTEELPELFYQHLYNWSVERNTHLAGQAPQRWICLERAVGDEDRAILRTLGGHDKGITSVAFSPDGLEILTASHNNNAYLWEAATGRKRFSLQGHEASVSCVAFSTDGQLMITGSRDCTIRAWDRQSGALKYTWKHHRAGITCLACSHEGALIAGSNDGYVSTWRPADEVEAVQFWRTPMPVSALALARQRAWIIVASGDTLWVRERAAKHPFRLWQRENAQITHLAISSDERFLAFCTTDNPTVINLWDCERRVILRKFCGHTSSITSIAFTSDRHNRLLSGTDDATARLWDAASGQCLAILTGHTASITSVASSPDSRSLLTGSLDGAAHIWDQEMARQTSDSLTSQNTLAGPATHHRLWTTRMSTSPPQIRVLVAPQHNYALVVCGANAQLWNTQERTYVDQLALQNAEQLAFSTCEDSLFVKRADRIEIYTWSDGKFLKHELEAEQTEQIWREHVATPLLLTEDAWPSAQEIPLPGNPRYHLVSRVSRAAGQLTLIDTYATEQADGIGKTDWPIEAGLITHLSFSPAGNLLAVGDQRGCLIFLSWDGKTIGPQLGLYKAPGQIAALSWLSAERVLLVDVNHSGLPPHFHWLSLKGMGNL